MDLVKQVKCDLKTTVDILYANCYKKQESHAALCKYMQE